MTKLVCFSGVEAPNGVIRVKASPVLPEHNVYHAIVDGELTTVKVLPERDLFGNPGFAIWPGLFECEFNADGYVVKTRIPGDAVVGYSVGAPGGGSIELGVERTAYKFEPDAPAYIVENGSVIADFKTTVAALEPDWSGNWFIRLNGAGAISEMYIFRQMMRGSSSPLLDEIRKFKPAWGPVDPATGLAIEYTYFEPSLAGRLPVFVWLHGLHGGSSLWTSHFEWNPIASWAGEKYQSQFADGGSYIFVPRANEDLHDGHGLTWNDAHVEPLFLALDDFLDKHPNADRSRVIVGGYSMGGGMTWLMLRARPDYFAGAVPCCPTISYLPPEDELGKFDRLPIWQIVGKGDTAITAAVLKIQPELTRRAEAAGTDSRFLQLPKGYKMPDGKTNIPVDHCVWIPMFNNLLFDDGSPYADLDGVPVKSTLIAWLNGLKR